MRKNYSNLLCLNGMRALVCAAVLGMAAVGYAQQLPNVGFEEEWVDCRPWTSVTDTMTMKYAGTFSFGPTKIEGIQPASWTVSDVLGVVSPLDEGDGYGALGATEVGFKVEGYNSGAALKLKNNPNPFMATQIVPAYVSLGKTWATNTLDWTTFQPADKDGGVFGGIEFTNRPDALVFDYKRGYGDENKGQSATALVYAWKGEWQQADVPGNNSMSAETVKVTMVDRDRNILGMETAQGGEVTHSEDAELIAKGLKHIEGEANEWTSFVLPIEYYSDATPEKINVVLAANDYFDSENIVNGDSLIVDNVKLAYFSRLSALKIDGVELEGFASDKYEYTVSGQAPAADKVEAVLLGQSNTAKATVSVEGDVVTVVVENAVGEDVDGKTSHTYTVTYGVQEGQSYNGYLNIVMNGGSIASDKPATIVITPEDETHCTFTLPDFSLDLGSGDTPLGDIVVPNVEMTKLDGKTQYTGSVEGMQLLGGALVADVNLEGTINDNGVVDMNITVMWNGMPIDVTFTSYSSAIENVGSDSHNVPVEYYNLNGVRINADNLPAGLYIRRQGDEVSKILVK